MVEKEKKREMSKEEKEFQLRNFTRALGELEIKKSETKNSIKKIERHLELDVPRKETEYLKGKIVKMLETGKTENDEEIPEVDMIKLKIDLEILEEEIKADLQTKRAVNGLNNNNMELEKLNNEINATLKLIKRFR